MMWALPPGASGRHALLGGSCGGSRALFAGASQMVMLRHEGHHR